MTQPQHDPGAPQLPDAAEPERLLVEAAESAAAPSLARTVSRGMGWNMGLNAVSKLAGFATQMILASLLAKEDFGVYMAALAVSNLVLIVRDGGVRELLIQRGASEYHTLLGPVFWMALAVNSLAAAVLAAAAPAAAAAYSMPDLTKVLLITALSLPLGTPGAVMLCRLRIDLRFALLSNLNTGSFFIRYVTMIALAALGYGAISFVVPLVAVAIFEGIAAFIITREHPWRGKPTPSLWPSLITQAKWLFLGSLAGMMVDQGDYFVAGPSLGAEALGVYGFANQLQLQSVYVLLSYATSVVLFPVLVRLVKEPERHNEASLRFLRTLTLLAAPGCIGLAAVFPGLEQWLFDGKWHAAIVPLQVLSLMYPIRCTVGLTTAMLMSQGRFKRWSVYTLLEGAAVMLAAAFTSSVWGTPTAIAAGAAITLSFTRLIVTGAVVRLGGGGRRHVLAAIGPAWCAALACGLITYQLDKSVWTTLPGWLRVGLAGASYAGLYIFAARLLLARQIREALAVLPARLVPVAERFMLMHHRADH